MLYLSEGYHEKFGKLLLALGRGAAPVETFQQLYGKTLAQVHDDLNSYMRGERFYAALFDTKLRKAMEAPRVAPASPFESGMVLLELLASTSRGNEQARAMLSEMEGIAPESAEAAQALAAMAMQVGDKGAAARHLERAVKLGSKNAKFFFDYAAFLQRSGEGPSVFLPHLERASELDPNYDDAHYLAGSYAYQGRDFKKAARYLGMVRKVTDKQAYPFFSMLSYSRFEAGLRAEAQTAAESARKYAKTPEEIANIESLVRYLSSAQPPAERLAEQAGADQNTKPPAYARAKLKEELQAPPSKTLTVEGTVRQIDCAVNGAMFHLLSNGRQLRYSIDDPNRVVLKNSQSGTLNFTCGPQPKPFTVALEFEPMVDEKTGSLGLIRVIEFK